MAPHPPPPSTLLRPLPSVPALHTLTAKMVVGTPCADSALDGAGEASGLHPPPAPLSSSGQGLSGGGI